MHRNFFLKIITLINILFLSTHTAYADHFIECPSIDKLNTLHYEFSFPYSFDQTTKSMRFIAISDQFSHKNDDHDNFVFVVYPLLSAADEDPQIKLHKLVKKLQPESSTPFIYQLNKTIKLPICVYTFPGNEKINALVYFDNGYLRASDSLQLLIKQMLFN